MIEFETRHVTRPALARRVLTALLVLAGLLIIVSPAIAQGSSPPPATATLVPTATVTPTPAPTPTLTPTFTERHGETILSDIIAPLVVLVFGGFLTALAGYLLRPHLDDWLERRRRARQAAQDRRRAAEEAVQREQITDARARTYLDNLIAKLRDLKILDMSRPLDLERSYVRLRVRQEARAYPRPEEERALADVERDPDEWLRLRREWEERRAQAAVLPEAALREHRRLVVLGDPGAGKTTMLKHLALCAAQGRLEGLPALPVLASLHLFARSDFDDLLDFVAHDWATRYGFPEARAYLEGRLEAGGALLLLDALDEVNVGNDEAEAEATYRRVVEGINALVTRYRHALVVVTSRLAGWRGGLAAGFHTLEMLDLGPEEVEQFVANWFHDAPDKAAALGRDLARNARVAALAANPLLLSLIAIVYQKDLELPERRARLYERCVQVLLTEWDASRGVQRVRGFTTDHKRDLLEAVAWYFHCAGRRYFPQEELLVVIADFLPQVGLPATQSAPILAEIAAQHGLLKEQAIGWYGFLHLTLQEYFAALAADRRGALGVVLANLHRPWWEEVTLLLAGLGDAAPLLRGILAQPEDIFYSNLRLAGRCLAGRPRVSEPALYDEVQAQLRARMRAAELPGEAERLARVLAELGSEANNALLLALLTEEEVDWRVRASIANALGALGDRRVAPRLGELLSEEKMDPSVGMSIAAALGVLGERCIVPRLLELLAEGSIKVVVQARIAIALGALGERSVAASLVEILAGEKTNRWVRWGIANALGTLGEQSVVPRLIELLAEERTDELVRMSIADALGALGDRGVVPRLLELLTEEKLNKRVRWGIANALGTLGERSVVPRLVELLAEEKTDELVRMSIADALGALGDRSVVPRLLELLTEEKIDTDVRASIAAALGALGEQRMAPCLVELLVEAEIDWRVRQRIADALGVLGEKSVVPQLVELLAEEKIYGLVRWHIAATLEVLGERRVAPRLLELLTQKKIEVYVRGHIAEALGALGDTIQVAHDLAALLRRTKDPELRESIYAALYRVVRRAGVRVLQNGYVVPLGGGLPLP